MLLTQEMIIENIVKENGELNQLNYLSKLPDIIIYIQKEYKNLMGKDKKKICILVILSLFQDLSKDETEELTKILSTYIDSLVYIAKTSGKLFEKVKKSKCKCWK